MPVINVPNIAELVIEKPRIESDPKEIDDALSRLADENRQTVALAKPRAAKVGDVINIDFVGRINGEAFEGGAAEGHALELGSNSFIPGFEDGLLGAKADETRDVNVSFPEDYQAAHLAGKPAIFEVTVKELREKGEASIDDQLGQNLGFEDLERLEIENNKVIKREKVLDSIGRVRNVEQGPDGYLYVGVEGKGILKIIPTS